MFKKIIFVFLFAFTLQFAQTKQAIISSDFLVVDFGTIDQFQKVYTKFELYNTGNDTLRIKSVIVSSYSVQTRLFKKIIAPSDSAELYIKYNPDVREREQMEYITVNSNATNKPKFQLTIKADVKEKEVKIPKDSKAPIIYFPRTTHDFGKLKKGEVKSYIFEFFNKGKSTLKILNIKTSCGCTAAIMSSNEIPPGGKGKIKVEFDSTTEMGKTRRSVRIISNDPVHPKTYLNIFADVTE